MTDAATSTQQEHLRIGVARLRENFLNHAELIFGRFLAAQPDHGPASRYLGVALCKMGRVAEGLALLETAAARLPHAPDVLADLTAARTLAGGGRAGFSTDQADFDFKVIDYPYRASVRYGGGRPSHPGLSNLIARGRDHYAALLSDMGQIQADFARLPLGGTYDTAEPFWLNSWFPPLDGMALTQMLRAYDPATFMEVGSGVSTKFARRAVGLYGLGTRLVSIDPQPRNDVDALCDEVLRKPLEDCDLALFDRLEPGDIFFLDSSHRAFQGSDVTVFFLDILPRLKPGVIIQIHDIYLPDDYVSGHVRRMWNEQYLLATALLYGADAFEVLFPSWYVGQDPELARLGAEHLKTGPLHNLNLYGASFWMRKRA